MSVLLLVATLAVTACGTRPDSGSQIDPLRRDFAMREAESLRARGARVWCVPFARNLSGVEIRGNARTWWGQAQSAFDVGSSPSVGAVMAFSATRSMPLGHVAVVSELVNERMLRVDHANWHRNKVSLGMAVVDVSENNDWSKVRLESNPGAFGSVYPINGFIRPNL
ncbi:CHAP domain-containing protein [Epibacterium sp. Ofav1-8]|uniref:CHAP domain-containing protein n=1 Tax=Epibacterium sp. Ofav1-8 TaxID=2917735 RepID=UPI001EF4C3F8|nr:CHAP domain-containing protein [Epibacterium sp. Ofav1-8]MCG7621845.1 CHAP domain-containing protein [Epibacterium sp. Ofav1-8]